MSLLPESEETFIESQTQSEGNNNEDADKRPNRSKDGKLPSILPIYTTPTPYHTSKNLHSQAQQGKNKQQMKNSKEYQGSILRKPLPQTLPTHTSYTHSSSKPPDSSTGDSSNSNIMNCESRLQQVHTKTLHKCELAILRGRVHLDRLNSELASVKSTREVVESVTSPSASHLHDRDSDGCSNGDDVSIVEAINTTATDDLTDGLSNTGRVGRGGEAEVGSSFLPAIIQGSSSSHTLPLPSSPHNSDPTPTESCLLCDDLYASKSDAEEEKGHNYDDSSHKYTKEIRIIGNITRAQAYLDLKLKQHLYLTHTPLWLRLPIVYNTSLETLTLATYIDRLTDMLLIGNNTIYVYSRNGHDRCGMICACIIGRLYGLATSDTLSYIQYIHDTTILAQESIVSRICISNIIQRQSVIEYITHSNQHYIPAIIRWSDIAVYVDQGQNYGISDYKPVFAEYKSIYTRPLIPEEAQYRWQQTYS